MPFPGGTPFRQGRELVNPPEAPRTLAYEVLCSVEEKDAFADRVLDARLQRQAALDTRDRSLATELVYGILRRRGTLDRCLKPHLRKPLGRLDREVVRILRMGTYQILFLDRVPDHAAVNESVTLAHRYCRPGAGSLVNAVLRSICREKGKKAASPQEKNLPEKLQSPEADFPDWLVTLWTGEMGRDKAGEMFRELLSPPEPVLRANTLKTDPDSLIKRLDQEGFIAGRVEELPGAVRLLEGGDIRKTACYRQGWCVRQDTASQVIVNLLNPLPGERVLDLCAAPGIKTTQAGQKMNNKGRLVAMDINPSRLRELSGLCARTGISIARPICADAGGPAKSCFSGRPFARIMVDAPCSGLGILRRNPERKWRPAPGFEALQRLQGKILNTAARHLRDDGILVYSTCTVHRQENEDVIQGFLDRHEDFILEDISRFLPPALKAFSSSDGYIRSWEMPWSFDMFFAARLRRVSKRNE